MDLAHTQTRLVQALQAGCDAARREAAMAPMRANERIPRELALRIYSNNVDGARRNALAVAYPACLRVLGETCFNGLAQLYVELTPSTDPDLNDYGAGFGDYLDDWTTAEAHLAPYRYLGDLARLERLCHTAYYAADDPPFDFTAFVRAAQARPQALRLCLGHSVGLLRTEYPVMAIRATNLSEQPACEIASDGDPEYLVVSRPANRVEVERVAPEAFGLLAAARAGRTLAQLSDPGTQLAPRLAETLPLLIHHGWISGFALEAGKTPEAP